jgi:hypothetical protein
LPFGSPELRGWVRGALGLLPAAAAKAAEEQQEEEEEEEMKAPSCSVAQVAALLRCVAGAQGFPLAAVEAEIREIIIAGEERG